MSELSLLSVAILKIITSIISFMNTIIDHHHYHDHLDDDHYLNLQSALKSPPSTTGAAAETDGGSLKTAEKLVCARCFKQWMSEGDNCYYQKYYLCIYMVVWIG